MIFSKSSSIHICYSIIIFINSCCSCISNLTKETLTDAISYFKESPLPVAKKYLDKGSVLKMAIKIPVYLFAYFLFSYVLVEALRALFSLPGRRSS